MRRALPLAAALLLAACAGSGSEDVGTFVDPDGGTAPGPDAAAAPPDAGGPADAGAPVDAGAVAPDAGPLDGGPAPVTPCSTREFRLLRPGASSVWLTGAFTGWAPTPADGAIEMASEGDAWVVTAELPSGQQPYKFIVDGDTWVEDPANPDQVDDGFGGVNSLVDVCPGGEFEVRAHRTAGDRFEAVVAFVGAGDAAAATATLDHEPVAPGALVTQGRLLQVNLQNLAPGIHDLRLSVGGATTLLKVYVDTSTDWRDTLMYFVMTDRFRNGDPSNDAPVGGPITHPMADYLGGDFAGLRWAIEGGYFDALGANALWITWPLDNTDGAWEGPYSRFEGCEYAGPATAHFSGYHGYWPSSGTEMEARFGTLEELQAVVDAAHARGIRILLDFAANHVHQDSPYFADHPEWFNLPAQLCRDGLWDGDLKEECWFDSFLPDWAFTNPAARRRVLDDAVDVAKSVGADGFRVDALKHMEDAFVRDLRRRVEAELEQTGVTFYLVGETFTGDVGQIAYYVNDQMMHGQFDFPSNMAIRQAFAYQDLGLDGLHTWVRENKAGYGAASPWMSTFAGNHDIARFVSKASGDLPCGIWNGGADMSRAHGSPPSQPTDPEPYRRLRLAMTYTYAVPGIPLLYYGDEVGLAGAGDPDNRRMLPEDTALNDEMRATRRFVQRLGQLRAEQAVLRTGDWTPALWADANTLVFARTLGPEVALVVLNRGGARTVDVDVSALGLSDGALTAGLGDQDAAVSGGRVTLDLTAGQAEIYLR